MATPRDLDIIVELVQQLTPEERRLLMQRLRVSGLLPPSTLLTDQNRLDVAPSMGKLATARHADPSAASAQSTPSGASSTSATAGVVDRPLAKGGSAALPLRMAGSGDTGNRRTSGKVVIGAPDHKDLVLDPHVMTPLPGQAPEQPIVIIFDGGSKGNPGYGYGSYALRWPGQPQQIVQLQFGDNVTNNEAEYDTLIGALEAVYKRLRETGVDLLTAKLDIRGDSQLVVSQVHGEWKCTEDRLRTRRNRVRTLLREFGAWELTHHPRENSVRILGH